MLPNTLQCTGQPHSKQLSGPKCQQCRDQETQLQFIQECARVRTCAETRAPRLPSAPCCLHSYEDSHLFPWVCRPGARQGTSIPLILTIFEAGIFISTLQMRNLKLRGNLFERSQWRNDGRRFWLRSVSPFLLNSPACGGPTPPGSSSTSQLT